MEALTNPQTNFLHTLALPLMVQALQCSHQLGGSPQQLYEWSHPAFHFEKEMHFPEHVPGSTPPLTLCTAQLHIV